MTRCQVQIVAFESAEAFSKAVGHNPGLVLGPRLEGKRASPASMTASVGAELEAIAVLFDGQAFSGAALELFLNWCKAAESVHARAIVAGCICCVGGPALRTEVVRTLRQFKPAHLVVVASTDARLDKLADALLQPTLAPHLELQEIAYVQITDAQDAPSLKKPPGSVSRVLTCFKKSWDLRSDFANGVGSDGTRYKPIEHWPNRFVFNRSKLLDLDKQPSAVVKMSVLLKELQLESFGLVARTEREWYQFDWSRSDQGLKTQVHTSQWRASNTAYIAFGQSEQDFEKTSKYNEINELIDILNSTIHSLTD